MQHQDAALVMSKALEADQLRRERRCARRIAQHLCLAHNVSDTYVDRIDAAIGARRPALTECVADWVENQAAEAGCAVSELDLADLRQRFVSHLADVFTVEA